MTGWALIICLLILGGILSTLGDLLGSKIGKARLSIFKLRPRRTAVLITILTGSFISAISLGLILLVSRQLRVGLFELDDLQTKLRDSRSALIPLQKQREVLEGRIKKGEMELDRLENNFLALRKGQVVITSGQLLLTSRINTNNKFNVKDAIEGILRKANYKAYLRVKPGEKPSKRILLVRRDHINKLEEILDTKGEWIVNIRSAGNVLLGENYVYAFPEATPNKNIVNEGEVIAKVTLKSDETSADVINQRIKILLASTLAEVKRRGSFATDIKLDAKSVNRILQKLSRYRRGSVQLEVVSAKQSDTADEVAVSLRISVFNL